ncbi:MAG TPA: hypothetical protein VFW07_11605 [Parafilimonas sp.]|nr:hypothetical protein [Parafilimonas sp.]
MSKEKLIIVLRWIGVLPCAVLASLSAYLLIFLFSRLLVNTDSWMAVYILPLTCSYISGFGFMTVGILLAPSHTRIVALILSAMLLILLRMGVMLVFSSKEYLEFAQYVTAVAGSTIAYLSLREAVEG